jgi:hypothetical protein
LEILYAGHGPDAGNHRFYLPGFLVPQPGAGKLLSRMGRLFTKLPGVRNIYSSLFAWMNATGKHGAPDRPQAWHDRAKT